MKKFLAIVLVFALLLAIPAGCNNKNVSKEMSSTYLVWNIGAEPKTFDPSLNSASDGGNIIMNLFEGLYREASDGSLEPAQAKSYEISDDGMTYTFKLRDDIKWSDGKPVVAGDFEYAWKRVCSSETASEYSFIMAPYLKFGQEYLEAGSVNFTDEQIANLKAVNAAITDAQYEMLKDCAAESDTEKEGVDYIPVPEEDLAQIKSAIRDLVGVKATDDQTLVVSLNFPCSYFMSLVTFYTYMPVRQDIVEANGEGWEKKPETCISNGAFVLEEYQIGSHLKLKKNELYYEADKVRLAGIKGVMLSEATTAHTAYKAGEIQVNETIPTDEIPTLLAEDPNFTQEAQVGTYYATFNCDKAPMNDVRVRKALTLAIDRKQICEQVAKGGQIPATGFIPPNLTYSDGTSCRVLDENGNTTVEYDIDPNKANIEEAKRLLAEAGYPNGEGFPTITYLYNTLEAHQKIAEAVQEMWKTNLGIDVVLENQEWQIFQDTRRKGNYDVARGGWLGDYPEPMTMLDLFTSYSGNNDSQWRWNLQPIVAPHDTTLNPANKEFDEAIEKAMVSTGKEKDEAYKTAEKIMMEDCILMPIYYYSNLFTVDAAKVTGVRRTKMGHWVFKDAEMLI